jgi:hypothetical protein
VPQHDTFRHGRHQADAAFPFAPREPVMTGRLSSAVADGSGPVNLTPDPVPAVTDESRPAWSPDGLRIAYASNASGDYDIWTHCARTGATNDA